MSLIKKIENFYKSGKSILFTTPSHAQGNFIPPLAKKILGKKFYKSDFSEIDGFDNLRAPSGIIKELQGNIAKIYNAKASFMLINGSTSGVLAAMISLLKENDKVLIARNSHISVYNGLVLTGAKPIWFVPQYDDEWGIYKGVKAKDVKKHFKKHNDIKAVIITSPTYEGIFSDINEISQLCKENNAFLIVDEAHGALLNFGNFKSKPAIMCGADISIQSLHKTAGAPNPCALLHVGKHSSIEATLIRESLNFITTTSPSYPLMSAIEATVTYLDSKDGKKHVENLLHLVTDFKNQIAHIADIYDAYNDSLRLLIKLKNKDNTTVVEFLNKKVKIEEEYSTAESMLFITGIGTDRKNLSKLAKAIKFMAKNINDTKSENVHTKSFSLPKIHYSPKEAFNQEFEYISTAQSLGRICAEPIISYPPGIPVLIPGEEISLDSIFRIEKSKIKVLK